MVLYKAENVRVWVSGDCSCGKDFCENQWVEATPYYVFMFVDFFNVYCALYIDKSGSEYTNFAREYFCEPTNTTYVVFNRSDSSMISSAISPIISPAISPAIFIMNKKSGKLREYKYIVLEGYSIISPTKRIADPKTWLAAQKLVYV
jgi:hypothetical protein